MITFAHEHHHVYWVSQYLSSVLLPESSMQFSLNSEDRDEVEYLKPHHSIYDLNSVLCHRLFPKIEAAHHDGGVGMTGASLRSKFELLLFFSFEGRFC